MLLGLRFLLVSVLCFSLSGFQYARADHVDQANAMMSFFSSGCPSVGEWTKGAVQNANSVIEILRSLSNDPSCKSLSGAIGQVNLLNFRIERLAKTQSDRELTRLKREQEELLLQLAAAETEEQRNIIRAQLRNVQMQMATYEGYNQSDKELRDNQELGDSLQTMVTTMNILLQQAAANTQCMEKNPGLAGGLASLAGSIGSVVLTGAASLGLAAATQLLGIFTEQARQHRIMGEINKFSPLVTNTAYLCALESLSNRWCAAQDASQIVKLSAKHLSSAAYSSPLTAGIKILRYDLPILVQWLEKIKTGADPANQSAADRQNRIESRRNNVNQQERSGVGIISENEALFNLVTNPNPILLEAQKFSIYKNTVQKLISAANGDSPASEVFDGTYAPYYLMGLNKDEMPFDANRLVVNFYYFDPQLASTYRDSQGGPWGSSSKIKINMVDLKSNFKNWMLLARDRADQELSLVFYPDPLVLIYDASVPDIRGKSPYNSLQKISEFLKANAPQRQRVGSHERLYKETQALIDQINLLVKDAITENTTTGTVQDPKKVINEIGKLLSLEFGTKLITGRIERAVRWSLNDFVLNPNNGMDVATSSQLLASEDLLTELGRYAGGTDLNTLDRDISRSQAMAETTLQGFVDVFSRNINGLMKSMEKSSKDSRDPNNKIKPVLAEYCLKLLATPTWPKGISKDLCKGMQLTSIFVGGPSSLRVDNTTIALPLEKRACAYRNFFRENKIYQNYFESGR